MKLKKGTIPMILGLLLMAAALGLWVFNIWTDQQARSASLSVIQELDSLRPQVQETIPHESAPQLDEEVPPDYVLYPEMEMPVTRVRGQDYIGTLSIPSLELQLPVISWWSGDGFQIAPCRYSGSAYMKNLVLAAHNYPSHFGKIKALKQGDALAFTDMSGNVFSYQVVQQEILQGTDVEEMENSQWDLTLFTCTTGGKYRVTVRCQLVENSL